MKKYEPRFYQDYATSRILDTPAILLMLDMGLGKTISTLTAVADLMHNQFEIAKTLVIAPKKVADSTWIDECEEWQHTSYFKLSKILGNQKDRIDALNTQADIYTINRENVVWLVEYYGRAWPFDMVVIDESSSFKSHSAKRFKALKKVRPLCKRVVELTGTPAPNGLMDLWAQVYLLDRGERLGKTISAYRDKYFLPDQRDGHIVYSYKLKDGAEEEIYKKIADICVSMKGKEYLNLPEPIMNVIPVSLPPQVKEKYDQFEKDLVLQIADSEVVANTAAVLSNKLLQLANGAVYDEDKEIINIHDEKLEVLAEIIDVSAPKNVTVLYNYQHDLKRLKERFPQARELKSNDDIKDWNAGKIKILLVHPASAGHGLNLQFGGSIAIWFGLTWSLELYQQANKRLHRPGQKETVVIHHLVAKGTMDEDVMRSLRGKAVGQDGLIEAVKARIEKYKKAG